MRRGHKKEMLVAWPNDNMGDTHTHTRTHARTHVLLRCFSGAAASCGVAAVPPWRPCDAFAVLLRCCCGTVAMLLRCFCGFAAVLLRCCCGLRRCCGAAAVLLRCCCGVAASCDAAAVLCGGAAAARRNLSIIKNISWIYDDKSKSGVFQKQLADLTLPNPLTIE